MKKNLLSVACMLIAACAMFTSCTKDVAEEVQGQPEAQMETRAYGDKSPKTVAYVEVNDTNPLNVGSYKLGDGYFYDIAIIFAANVHADANGDPALHFNDNVTQIMGNVDKYIRPLQAKGIKVTLSILGDHKGIGVANLTDAQAEIFANILTYTVNTYGLDGIDFDDEYAKYGENGFPGVNNTSYSAVINKLRAKLGPNKLITVFDWGYTNTISSAATANINFAWYGVFGTNSYGSWGISGLTRAQWSAQAINLNSSFNSLNVGPIKTRSAQAKNDGNGAIMTYDIRVATQRNPLLAIQKIAEGAGFTGAVTYDGNAYTKDWTVGATKTITKNDI